MTTNRMNLSHSKFDLYYVINRYLLVRIYHETFSFVDYKLLERIACWLSHHCLFVFKNHLNRFVICSA